MPRFAPRLSRRNPRRRTGEVVRAIALAATQSTTVEIHSRITNGGFQAA
jgi:hypothetical protein